MYTYRKRDDKLSQNETERFAVMFFGWTFFFFSHFLNKFRLKILSVRNLLLDRKKKNNYDIEKKKWKINITTAETKYFCPTLRTIKMLLLCYSFL